MAPLENLPESDHFWYEMIDPSELSRYERSSVRRRRFERLVAGGALVGAVVASCGIFLGADPGSETAIAAAPDSGPVVVESPVVKTHTIPEQVDGILATLAVTGEPMASTWVPVRCAQYADLVSAAGLPAWMLVVAWRESRCDPGARNLDLRTRDDSWGLFQINTLGDLWSEVSKTCGLTEPAGLLDPAANISCAGRLHALYGYQPWHAGVYFGQET